jgi:hypothetical protein
LVALKEFKKFMVDLSILTGKAPTCYGKKAADDKQLDYMIEVYHRAIRGYEFADIEAAFNDSGLRKEIVDGFGLNVDVIEKYIVMARNRRVGRKDKEVGLGEFKPIPRECKEALRDLGIDIDELTEDKAMEEK